MENNKPKISKKELTEIGDNYNISIKTYITFILKYSPVLFALMLVLLSIIGFAYEIPYYKKFNINILEFAKPNDFFFHWARDSITLVMVLGSFSIIICALLGFHFSYKRLNKNESMMTKIIIFLIFGVIIIIIVILARKWSSYLVNPIHILIMCILLSIFYPLNIFFIISITKNKILLNILFFVIIVLFLFSVISSAIRNSEQKYNKVISEKSNIYMLTLENDECNVIKNRELYLIGNTNTYHFFYDYKSNDVLIVPSSKILILNLQKPRLVNPIKIKNK